MESAGLYLLIGMAVVFGVLVPYVMRKHTTNDDFEPVSPNGKTHDREPAPKAAPRDRKKK